MQPIEHLASFRAMPNILMLRPGDGTETAGAYKVCVYHTATATEKRPPGVVGPNAWQCIAICGRPPAAAAGIFCMHQDGRVGKACQLALQMQGSAIADIDRRSVGSQAAMDNTRGDNVEKRVRPSVLALSRQKMPNLEGTSIEGVCKGGYTVYGGEGKPDAIIMATGAPRGLQRLMSSLPACSFC